MSTADVHLCVSEALSAFHEGMPIAAFRFCIANKALTTTTHVGQQHMLDLLCNEHLPCWLASRAVTLACWSPALAAVCRIKAVFPGGDLMLAQLALHQQAQDWHPSQLCSPWQAAWYVDLCRRSACGVNHCAVIKNASLRLRNRNASCWRALVLWDWLQLPQAAWLKCHPHAFCAVCSTVSC